MSDIKKLPLGAGKTYLKEFTGTLPEIDTIIADENLIGETSGGASLSYKPTFYKPESDSGYKWVILTKEEATFKTGIMTWNGETIAKLCQTATVSKETGKTITKIGGLQNAVMKSFVIVFVGNDFKLIIVGTNEAGLELAFSNDKETVINTEFTVLPQDSEGTLIQYIEEDASIVVE